MFVAGCHTRLTFARAQITIRSPSFSVSINLAPEFPSPSESPPEFQTISCVCQLDEVEFAHTRNTPSPGTVPTNFQCCCSSTSDSSDGSLQRTVSAKMGANGSLDSPLLPAGTIGRRIVASNQVFDISASVHVQPWSWLTMEILMADMLPGTGCDMRQGLVAGAAEAARTVSKPEA